jgi:hypothetical protein
VSKGTSLLQGGEKSLAFNAHPRESANPMQQQLSRHSASSLIRGAVASWIGIAFLSALALSVSPRWHELVHPDAKVAQHECAVTLIGSGSYQQVTPALLVVAPVPALQFCFIPTLRPVWVASPFLDARVLEHAPPAHA